MKDTITAILLRLWRMLRGKWQWYLLWAFSARFMVSVAGVVVHPREGVLLLRHRFWQTGEWGLPGGIVKRGERLEDALARELKEETGYDIRPAALLEVRSGYRLRIEVFYAALWLGGTEILDPREIIEARFFPADAIPAGMLPGQREMVERILAEPERYLDGKGEGVEQWLSPTWNR